MTGNRSRIIQAFSEAGNALLETYWSSSYELVNLHDIHGFYRFNEDLAVHVQGYPGMSKENKMLVSMRLRDYKKMMDIRAKGEVSVGNEHESNLPFSWDADKFFPYDDSQLVFEINSKAARYLLSR